MMLSQKLMFNPSSGVWFWDGTIALTGKLSHLRILILVFDFLLDWITSCELGFPHDFPWFTLDWITSCKLGFSPWFPVIYFGLNHIPQIGFFPFICRDLITSWELGFSPWFPVIYFGLNHIPQIGFFPLTSHDLITSWELGFCPWFPVIYCWIESHLVN